MESKPSARRLGFFERFLTLWVALCMGAGLLIGKALPGVTDALRKLEFGTGSQINLPIAVLIWLMIYPMMLKIDFASVLGVRNRPAGLLVTLFVNWLVKPFSMAFLGWLFFKQVFFHLRQVRKVGFHHIVGGLLQFRRAAQFIAFFHALHIPPIPRFAFIEDRRIQQIIPQLKNKP